MAISFIASANINSYDLDGTFVVNKPTGTASGDVMFTMINTFNGAPVTVPSGWTLVKNQNNATPSLGTYVYRKTAGGSEPSSYTWVLDNADLAAQIVVHTYRGVDAANPVTGSISAVSTTAESLASGNVTVSTPGTWLLAVSGCRHNGTTACSASMASMTERTDLSAADTAGSFSRSMATYDSNGSATVGTATRTAVVTGTTLAHTVILISIRPELSLAETLTDNFDDNSVDTNKWVNGGGSFTGSVVETNGRIEITDSNAGSSAKGLGTKVPYDLRGSYVQTQIVSVFTDSHSQIFPIRIYKNAVGDSTWAGIQVFNGNILVTDPPGSISYSATYSPTTHKFVRVREASGTVYFDCSSDGVNWTNMTSGTTAALGFSVDEVWFSIEHFNSASTTTTSTAAVDNYNVVPVLNTVNKTDDEDLSDSASTSVARPRSANDAEDLSDALTKALGYNRSASDGEDLSDSLSVAKGFARSTSDTEELSDSSSSVLGYNRTASDSVDLSDSVSIALNRMTVVTDAVSLDESVDSDLVIDSQDFTFDGADGLGLSDSATTVQGFNRSAEDGEDLSDSVSRVAEYTRSATDALSLSDTASAALNAVQGQEDGEGLSDSLTTVLGMSRVASDDTGLSDSVSIAVARVVEFSDDESLSDDTEAETGTIAHASDLLSLDDLVTRIAEYRRDLEDTLGLADSLSAALDVVLSTDDTLSLSDAATAALSTPRSASDVVSLSDSVTISIARNLKVSDSLDLNDQTAIDVEFAEIVSDLEELSDSMGWHLSILVSDSLGLSDSADTDGGLRLLERTDVLTLSDSVVTGLYRTTVEPLERKTSIGTPARMSRTEDIERKWSIS